MYTEFPHKQPPGKILYIRKWWRDISTVSEKLQRRHLPKKSLITSHFTSHEISASLAAMLDYYLRSSFPHLLLKPWKPGNDFPWPENTGNTSHSRPSLIMRELQVYFYILTSKWPWALIGHHVQLMTFLDTHEVYRASWCSYNAGMAKPIHKIWGTNISLIPYFLIASKLSLVEKFLLSYSHIHHLFITTV